MKPYAVCLVGLSVAACAPSVPVVVVAPAPASARQARPASDVMNAAAVTPRDGAGAIVVTREQGWAGSGCTYDVALDDQHVAGLRPGEQITLYADPGERTVGISVRGGDDCDPAIAQVPVRVVAQATSTMYIRGNPSSELKIDVNTYGGSLPP